MEIITKLSLTSILCFVFSFGFSQKEDFVASNFDKFNQAYLSNEIADTTYMNQVRDFSYDVLGKGIYLTPDELRKHLVPYEKIAFGNNEYASYRIDYHIMFLNNAAVFDKRGEAMYFAEKTKREYTLQNQPSLIELAQKCQIFSTQKNFIKVIEAYEEEKDFIYSLSELLAQNKIKPRIALDALHVLSPVSASYASLGDSLSLAEIFDLSKRIVKELRPKTTSPYNLLLIDLHLLEQAFFKAAFKEDYDECRAILNKVEKLKTTYSHTNTEFLNLALTEWKSDFYIRTEEIDSAEYYIQKYNELPQLTNDIKERIMRYSAKIEFLKKNYKDAFLKMEQANLLGDSIRIELIGELDQLLYSFTKAEDTQNELIKIEKAKRNQTIFIIGLCIVFIITISTFISMKVRKNKRIHAKIRRLKNVANLQIATMEEIAFQAVKKEQKRLGEDLHNSAASGLSAIKHQIGLLLLQNGNDNKEVNNTLKKIQTQVEDVYQLTRNKSHEWHSLSDQKEELLFSQQIQTNLELFFPSAHFNKTVEIDEDTLKNISSYQKIELLKVIQEALTNIIKHAKAKNISLLLYRENDNSLSLIIKNDGRTSIKEIKKGLGLKSITSRIVAMKGTVITNTDDGFELSINLPTQ